MLRQWQVRVQKHFTDQLLVYPRAEFGPGNHYTHYTLLALHVVNIFTPGRESSHLVHPFLCTLVRSVSGKAHSHRNMVLEDLA